MSDHNTMLLSFISARIPRGRLLRPLSAFTITGEKFSDDGSTGFWGATIGGKYVFGKSPEARLSDLKFAAPRRKRGTRHCIGWNVVIGTRRRTTSHCNRYFRCERLKFRLQAICSFSVCKMENNRNRRETRRIYLLEPELQEVRSWKNVYRVPPVLYWKSLGFSTATSKTELGK